MDSWVLFSLGVLQIPWYLTSVLTVLKTQVFSLPSRPSTFEQKEETQIGFSLHQKTKQNKSDKNLGKDTILSDRQGRTWIPETKNKHAAPTYCFKSPPRLTTCKQGESKHGITDSLKHREQRWVQKNIQNPMEWNWKCPHLIKMSSHSKSWEIQWGGKSASRNQHCQGQSFQGGALHFLFISRTPWGLSFLILRLCACVYACTRQWYSQLFQMLRTRQVVLTWTQLTSSSKVISAKPLSTQWDRQSIIKASLDHCEEGRRKWLSLGSVPFSLLHSKCGVVHWPCEKYRIQVHCPHPSQDGNRTCILTRFPGDTHAHSVLGRAALSLFAVNISSLDRLGWRSCSHSPGKN